MNLKDLKKRFHAKSEYFVAHLGNNVAQAVVVLIAFNLLMHLILYKQSFTTGMGTFGDFLAGWSALFLIFFTWQESKSWRRKSLLEKKCQKAEEILASTSKLRSFLNTLLSLKNETKDANTRDELFIVLSRYRELFIENDLEEIFRAKESSWLYFEDPKIAEILDEILKVYDSVRVACFQGFHSSQFFKLGFGAIRDILVNQVENENWISDIDRKLESLRAYIRTEIKTV